MWYFSHLTLLLSLFCSNTNFKWGSIDDQGSCLIISSQWAGPTSPLQRRSYHRGRRGNSPPSDPCLYNICRQWRQLRQFPHRAIRTCIPPHPLAPPGPVYLKLSVDSWAEQKRGIVVSVIYLCVQSLQLCIHWCGHQELLYVVVDVEEVMEGKLKQRLDTCSMQHK